MGPQLDVVVGAAPLLDSAGWVWALGAVVAPGVGDVGAGGGRGGQCAAPASGRGRRRFHGSGVGLGSGVEVVEVLREVVVGEVFVWCQEDVGGGPVRHCVLVDQPSEVGRPRYFHVGELRGL